MLNAFQLRALVPYLSPEDATTIEDFELSELAENYYVETINLRYSKLENKNHLFDVFAKYSGYEDSTYTRLDMLTFVAENTAQYEWNAHVLLKMHGMNLDGWVKTMTDCLNRGDELSIYAMCDTLKRHAFVFTHTKPWTMVDGTIGTLTVPELCMMCDVQLIYLGNNKFGERKCKPELLSPLPKPKLFKNEPLGKPLSSPPAELVVRILDESQSSCTLVTLPVSLETTQIEAEKKELSMKPDGETSHPNVSTSTQPVETSTVTSIDENKLEPNETKKEDSSLPATNEGLPNNETRPSVPVQEVPLTDLHVETKNSDIPTANNKLTMTNKETGSSEQQKHTEAEKNDPVPTTEIKSPTPKSTTQGLETALAEPLISPQSPKNIPSSVKKNCASESSQNTSAPGVKLCTVRLEILTEADIVKYVHVHKENLDSVETDKTVETVETEETVHFTRSHARPTPTRKNRLPQM